MKKTEFLKGDIVIWTTVIGQKECTVLEVSNDNEGLGALLVSHDEKAFWIIQPDATLKERPKKIEYKTYSRKTETAKPIPEYDNSNRDDGI